MNMIFGAISMGILVILVIFLVAKLVNVDSNDIFL